MEEDRRAEDMEETPIQTDDSYPLTRRMLHAPYVGLDIGSGEAEADEVAAARATLEAELASEGLSGETVRATIWNVGRSAGAFSILIYVGGAVVAIAAGIKKVDEAIPILQKWWRAIKRARERLGGGSLTTESLKLACINDLVERLGPKVAPQIDRIVVAAGAAQYGDGTWSPANPLYILIPDPSTDRTHLYVVKTSGEILHRAELPYFGRDQSDEFRLGPVSSVGAAREDQAVPEGQRDWDEKKR